jgi:hypothetical protein
MVYHLYRQPMTALLVRQCLMVMFLTCTVLRLGVVIAAGDLASHVIWVSAVAFPVVTVVTWLHARYPLPLPQRQVQWLVCGLLLVAGLSLIVSAL